ncbi:chemotaxis protein CheW [Desulfococcaceae bacterium HSG7]|nr:chemotaxis protein CheW [Desulfococcaceae bacterium HSG7]
MEERFQFCTFMLEKFLFGVEAHKVQEICLYQEMTRVPLAPPDISGLLNLRGQIITAIELRCKLGFDPRPDKQKPMNIVLRASSGAVSLLVDEIGDVIEVEDRYFEPPPETLDAELREIVVGVYKLEKHQLMHVIDIEKVAN